jgi:NTP pyrophosphatase (non-canonical NTP hydrolase)
MTANQYQQLALRTENTPDFFDYGFFTKDGEEIGESARQRARLLHGLMGVATESGELMDPLKRELIYGKGLDEVNVMEECGDLLWYIALALDAAGYTMEEAMERNISKLRARFPNRFTEEDALNRDLDAERRTLEDKS